MTIKEFLQARLKEDEAIAYNALGLLGIVTPWHDVETLRKRGLSRADAQHVARHSAQRALREVAAKRLVLNAAGPRPVLSELGYAIECMLLVYVDHPDYDEEWA